MKTFISFVSPKEEAAVQVEVDSEEAAKMIANFLELFYSVKSMVSQGETYEESESVYMAGFED